MIINKNNYILFVISILLPGIFYIIPIFNISKRYEEIFFIITAYLIISLILAIRLVRKNRQIEITKSNVWHYYFKIALPSLIVSLLLFYSYARFMMWLFSGFG